MERPWWDTFTNLGQKVKQFQYCLSAVGYRLIRGSLSSNGLFKHFFRASFEPLPIAGVILLSLICRPHQLNSVDRRILSKPALCQELPAYFLISRHGTFRLQDHFYSLHGDGLWWQYGTRSVVWVSGLHGPPEWPVLRNIPTLVRLVTRRYTLCRLWLVIAE